MKSQRWSILIALILLNYLVFASLFRLVTLSQRPTPTPTRTPMPTYTPGETWHIITPTWQPLAPTPTVTRVILQPTPTPKPTSTPTSTPTPRIHVVKEGENLSWIARRYGITVEAILQANGLKDPDLIYPGQKLLIP